MRRKTLLSAIGVFFGVAPVIFTMFLFVIIVLGALTDSGLLGICGPYGPAANILWILFLAALPASVIVGAYASWRTHRYLREHSS
jgi:hypothetical protein